jgi:hypothetical protein
MLYAATHEPDFSFIWLVQTAQDLNESTLARTIVADESDNLASA